MTWLAPGWLIAAAAISAVVVALHLLARRRPSERVFPTARFIPPASVRATTRTLRPTDLLLLAARVLAIMLVGAAFAGPVITPERRPLASVVVADLTRAVGNIEELRAAVRGALGDGDRLVVFDSAARSIPGATPSFADSMGATDARGSISAALVEAARAARAFAAYADTVEIVLVSPLVAEEFDPATLAVRGAIPHRVRVVRIAAAAPPVRSRLRDAPPSTDPVGAAAALFARRTGDGPAARVRREPATIGRPSDAGVEVNWPVVAEGDTIPAVIFDTGQMVVVPGPFILGERRGDGVPIVWTVDGEPVARERAGADGAGRVGGAGVASCVRVVDFDLPRAGDVALRADFGELLDYLLAPCGRPRLEPVADTVIARLTAGATTRDDAGREAADSAPSGDAPWRRWFFAGAAAVALVEPLLRRRRTEDAGA